LEKEEVSSGIDVWVKSVTYPVIKKRYAINDYHKDNGDGLDFYKVGQSRGCGGIAIIKDGDEFTSRNFRKWKIIANGPIRVVFELYYNPYDAGGIQVKETKRIQLDVGSNMNLIKSSLSWKGNNSINAGVGISRLGEGGQIKYELEDGILLYWPKANPEHGIVGCGLIVPDAKYVIDDNKSVYLSKKIDKSSTLTYYSGACWNKVKEFNDITKWKNYLYHFNNLINNPVEINYIK